MSFFGRKKAPSASETPPAKPPSAYVRARDEWLERYGDYIQSATQWRTAGVLSMLLCLLALAGNIYQLQQTKIIPYIVEVDKLGNAAATRSVQEGGEIPIRVIQAELVNVVTRWRTVTADIDLQKKMLSRLAAYIGGSAQGALAEWFTQNNPYKRAEKVLVSVDVAGMPLPVSKDSWRVAWKETVRSHTGATLEVTPYEATLSIIIVPPKDEAQIMANPAGIIVTSLSVGKILQN